MRTPVECRHCHEMIPDADINVSEGVAYCRPCGTLMRLSDILDEAEHGEADDTQPRGCIVADDGLQVRVRARAFSLRAAGFILFFCLIWNGVVSVFVLLAVGGTLQQLFGTIPSWFPAPTSQQSGTPNSIGELIFLWIFLIPFIAIGMAVFAALVTVLFGRVEVRLRGNEGAVLTGCGPIVWKRSFDVTKVTRTFVSDRDSSRSHHPIVIIQFAGRKSLRFGTLLPEERVHWMAATLRRFLMT